MENNFERERERERENSNSKTLILKDSSVRSIWTYLTASACYTTNTNKHDYTTNRYCKHEREGVRQRERERFTTAARPDRVWSWGDRLPGLQPGRAVVKAK